MLNSARTERAVISLSASGSVPLIRLLLYMKRPVRRLRLPICDGTVPQISVLVICKWRSAVNESIADEMVPLRPLPSTRICVTDVSVMLTEKEVDPGHETVTPPNMWLLFPPVHPVRLT